MLVVLKMATISFYDAEKDSLIEVSLSEEDAKRVRNDVHFATEVMNAAMKDEDNVLVAAPTSGVEDDGEEGPVYRWATPCVLFLLETYKEVEYKFTNGKNSQKKVWEEVATTLKNEGYKVTGHQCAAKLRSLKKTYKSVKDHNKKSGNDRRAWQFYELMDSIFCKKAWAAPLALASSSGLSVRPAEQLSSSSFSTSDEPSTSTTTTPIKTSILLAKRLRQKEEHEKSKAKRHTERMEIDQRFLAILEKIAKK